MNRGEALSAPLALPTERIAHLGAAGDCCAETAALRDFNSPMSALGQERTSPVHLAMSALPLKADIARPASRCPFSARISQCRRRGDQFVGTGHVLWYHVMADELGAQNARDSIDRCPVYVDSHSGNRS